MSAARALLSLLLLLAVGCAAEPRADDPSIVLVVVDTLRPDGLPFYGGEKPTPFLSALAERSLVFEEVWSTSTWTAPATASIFTSTHPERHGVETGMWAYHNLMQQGMEVRINRIRRSLETIPEFLSAHGYTTFGVSSNPNVSGPMGFRQGFDHFELFVYNGIDNARADMVVDRALAWAPELRSSEPFFLYLHFMDPHEPYVRNEQWIDPHERPTEDPNADRAAYDSEIGFLDAQLGRLFRELDVLDEAIIVVTSDHGQEFREHGGLGHGFTLYSELTRVPLLLHLPGRSAPRGRVAGRASVLDVLPTLRGLLGAPVSPQDAGVALLREGRPVALPERDLFASRVLRAPDGKLLRKRSVARGDFKLILTGAEARAELYDLGVDPGEQRDLAAARPEVVGELRAALDRHVAALPDRPAEAVRTYRPSDAELDALRRLGYVEEQAGPDAAAPGVPAKPTVPE